jgi:hypothetical protein
MAAKMSMIFCYEWLRDRWREKWMWLSLPHLSAQMAASWHIFFFLFFFSRFILFFPFILFVRFFLFSPLGFISSSFFYLCDFFILPFGFFSFLSFFFLFFYANPLLTPHLAPLPCSIEMIASLRYIIATSPLILIS